MVSKTFLLILFAFATIFVITSEVVAANESASNHGHNEVKDAKHRRDGYYNDGPGGDYDGGCGRYRNGGGGGYGGGYCRYGCCGGGFGGYDDRRCRCCISAAEATAYKQAHKAPPPAHN